MAAFTRPLLLLLTFNLLPQFGLRPLWVTLLFAAMLLFRFWLELSGRPPPKRAWVWGAQLIVVALIWNEFHSFFGEDAAGSFLLLLVGLKSFELNVKRDYFISTLLCVLLLMSDLLLDQSLAMSVFLLLDMLAILVFLRALDHEEWVWDFKTYLRPSLWLCAVAFPLLLLTFVLFPRFSTGFGSGGESGAKTGVTDVLKPGAVSHLVSSDELVFRATFINGAMPPRRLLYWRGAVLDRSHGFSWDRDQKSGQTLPSDFEMQKPDVEIYLEPGNDHFLFTLETTADLSFPNTSNRVTLREARIYGLVSPLQTRERYFLQNAATIAKESGRLDSYLQLDEKPSERMQKFLAKFAGQDPVTTVNELMRHFREGGYHYTLDAPPARDLEDFFFHTKTGFCEHFAGTLGTLLRELKIPARVVVGFQGGSRSFLENFISVRGQDAHAWVEYFDGHGTWRRADPTAEVAPLRLSQGSETFYDQKRMVPSWIPGGWATSYFKTRAFIDEVDASWVSFLLNFDLAKQKELLAKLGLEDVLFRALPVFLILAFAFMMAVIYFISAQAREKLPLEEKLYLQLLKRLRRHHIQREAADGPYALMAKIQDAALAARVEPVLARLTEARFGSRKLDAAGARELRRSLRLI